MASFALHFMQRLYFENQSVSLSIHFPHSTQINELQIAKITAKKCRGSIKMTDGK
jgi:hypothetical protein